MPAALLTLISLANSAKMIERKYVFPVLAMEPAAPEFAWQAIKQQYAETIY